MLRTKPLCLRTKFGSVPLIFLGLHLGCYALSQPLFAQATGAIAIEFREKGTDAPLASRVQILSAEGKPQRIRASLYQQGWNLVEAELSFKGRVGEYRYLASHGPQFSPASGGFTLDRKSEALDVVHLTRHADLKHENWIGGDMLVRVPAEEALRWLPAEDLSMATVVIDQGAGKRDSLSKADAWVERSCYVDSRPGSGLALHHWYPPAPVPDELPSSRLLVMAKQAASEPNGASTHAGTHVQARNPVHAEIQQLWARDVPIWLASGKVDSIQLLGEHLTIDGERALQFEPIIEPDPGRFRGPHKAGRLLESIYWELLETGLQIPPSAGSGFGSNSSPLGYNRIYAYPTNSTPAAWWQAVRDGRSMVTNGPLLRVTVNGEVPGYTFTSEQGQSIDIDIELKLTVADPVEYLEVVCNGATLYRARLDEHARQGGRIPLQTIRQSGWLLVRVVTDREHTYRLATTAPFYFVVGQTPRVSRSAVAFFQAWLERSAGQIQTLEPGARNAAAPYLSSAREFWRERGEMANAD